MKTYHSGDGDGLYVRRNKEWVFIGHQLPDPGLCDEIICLVEDIDNITSALQRIKHDVAQEEALAAETAKMVAWNQGGGVPDKQEYTLALQSPKLPPELG